MLHRRTFFAWSSALLSHLVLSSPTFHRFAVRQHLGRGGSAARGMSEDRAVGAVAAEAEEALSAEKDAPAKAPSSGGSSPAPAAEHAELDTGSGEASSEGKSRAALPSAASLARDSVRSAIKNPRHGLLDLCLLPLRIMGLPTSPHDFVTGHLLPSVLALGPIPRHIGFIMDGNRRFALASSMTVRQGHISGFQTLKKILEACLSLKRVECVTVYAFAIDNFKRSPSEVSALMELAKTRLIELTGHGELVARHSVRVKVIGRKHLLPPDVRTAVEKIEQMTKNHTRATLNICMPYASRDEMALAIRNSAAASLHASDSQSGSRGALQPDSLHSITKEDLASRMMLADSPPLDILVRTSGVSRLSDFMLWQAAGSGTAPPDDDADPGGDGWMGLRETLGEQAAGAQLHFIDCYWPEFGWGQLAPIILDWQRRKMVDQAKLWLQSTSAPTARS